MKMVKKKLEFSKKIFIFLSVFLVAVTVYSMFLMWYTMDTTPLVYLIPGLFGVYGTAVGFYMEKSKKENLLKIGNSIAQKEIKESSCEHAGDDGEC